MGIAVGFVYSRTDADCVFRVGMGIVSGWRYSHTFAKPAGCVGTGIAAAQAYPHTDANSQYAFGHVGPGVLCHVFAVVQVLRFRIIVEEPIQITVKLAGFDGHVVALANKNVGLPDGGERGTQIMDQITHLGTP